MTFFYSLSLCLLPSQWPHVVLFQANLRFWLGLRCWSWTAKEITTVYVPRCFLADRYPAPFLMPSVYSPHPCSSFSPYVTLTSLIAGGKLTLSALHQPLTRSVWRSNHWNRWGKAGLHSPTPFHTSWGSAMPTWYLPHKLPSWQATPPQQRERGNLPDKMR